jgi:hypothetical protein
MRCTTLTAITVLSFAALIAQAQDNVNPSPNPIVAGGETTAQEGWIQGTKVDVPLLAEPPEPRTHLCRAKPVLKRRGIFSFT